jgi:hypothetical protein
MGTPFKEIVSGVSMNDNSVKLGKSVCGKTHDLKFVQELKRNAL